MLSAFLMSLDTTEPFLTEAPAETARQIAYVRSVAEKTLDEIRAIVSDLRPTLLDELGLQAAVSAHAHRVLGSVGVSVEIETDGLATRLPPNVEVVLFRILQESLTDIAKHAGATQVGVHIARAGPTVRAMVTDNGARFEPAASPRAGEGRAIGVFAMRERAAAVGGQVSACPLPEAGTRIDVMLPCGDEPVEPGAPSSLSFAIL